MCILIAWFVYFDWLFCLMLTWFVYFDCLFCLMITWFVYFNCLFCLMITWCVYFDCLFCLMITWFVYFDCLFCIMFIWFVYFNCLFCLMYMICILFLLSVWQFFNPSILLKSNPNFRDITWNVEENMILHELFHVVSRFPRYISCYITESRLPVGQCTFTVSFEFFFVYASSFVLGLAICFSFCLIFTV